MNSENCVPFSSTGTESSGTLKSDFVPDSTAGKSTEPSTEKGSPPTSSPDCGRPKPICSALTPVSFNSLRHPLEPQSRQCRECSEHKTIDQFATLKRRKDGTPIRFWYCNPCRAKKDRGSPSLRAKDELIAEAKSKPCMDCGRTFPKVAMDFDHVRGVKRYNIGTDYRWISMDALKEEIAKTELVCACCHRVRTSRRPNQKRGRPRRVLADIASAEQEIARLNLGPETTRTAA